MKVLVTGGTGFIGSHLIAALTARGWQVRCFVRPTSRRGPLVDYEVEYIIGSLQDQAALRRAVQGVEMVFHLAGATRACVPADYDRINVDGTRRLLEACTEAAGGLRRFLYLSSIAAAGPSRSGQPLTEAVPPRPVGPYGRSKLRAEEAVLAAKSQLPVMVLRPSAIYGPGDTDFFQLFQAIKYGVLPQMGPQDLHVDLCFVTDLVQGVLAAADSPDGDGEVFFLGGAPHTWRQFGGEIARQMDVRPRHVRMPRWLVMTAAGMADGWARLCQRPSLLSRANVLERLQPFWLCDSGKAARTFGYESRTSMVQGIADTLQWYRTAGWL